MISSTQQRVVGKPLDRIDGPKKVTGTATYAYEHAVDEVTYAFPVQSTIAKGRIVSIDTSAAEVMDDWMNSPEHRSNILDCEYTTVGVGLDPRGMYWTQDFGGPA